VGGGGRMMHWDEDVVNTKLRLHIKAMTALQLYLSSASQTAEYGLIFYFFSKEAGV